MKKIFRKPLAMALAACLAGAVSQPALARVHHGQGHHGGGFHGRHHGSHHGGHHHYHGHRWHGSYGFYMDLTPAFWYPWYYHPYPYYGGATIIVQQPVQYVSREDNSRNYWYYCHNPKGYYPYVSQCNAQWVKVRPFPADAQK